MMKSLRLLIPVVFCAASVVATAQDWEMPPAAVVVAEAELRELAPSVDVPGTVISRNDSRLASDLSTRLEWIAEVGAVVKRGDVIARLSATPFELRVREAQSRVERERARVRFLTSEKDRLVKLQESNLSAKSRLDEIVSELAIAESDVEIARAQLGLMQYELEVTRIRAPFDGIVTERLRSEGERLNAADEIIRLVDPQTIEIVARAPLTTVNFIRIGAVLELHNDYRQDTATVRTIVPFGNPQSHMFEVRLDIDPDRWIVGESVRLSMPTAAVKQVLAVPRDALVLRREGASVFRVNSDLSVEQVNVITGLGDGNHIEVIGELRPGDRVVTRGAERLSDGETVSLNGAAAEGASTAASN